MLLQRRVWMYALALVLGGAVAAPVGAGEVDKYLPDDSEVVLTINVKQITESALFKKYGQENIQQLIKDSDEVNEVLKSLGFDPLKDVDHVVIAAPGGDDSDKGLIIVHGHFDVEKFKAKGEAEANANGDHLKIHKRETGPVIYEVSHEKLTENLFVALIDKNTLIASPGKDYVIDGLKKIDAKKATLKNKDIQTLLERMDSKQSVSVAMIGSAAAKSNAISNVIPKEVLENLDAVGGGFTVADDVKLELVLTAKSAEGAKEISTKVNDSVNDAILALAILVKAQKDFAPALDVVKAVRVTAKDKNVTIKGEVSGDQLETLSKALQGLIGQ